MIDTGLDSELLVEVAQTVLLAVAERSSPCASGKVNGIRDMTGLCIQKCLLN